MMPLTKFINKFGHFSIVVNLIILALLIFFKRFGIAETLGNFLLFLSMFVVFLQLLKLKSNKPALNQPGIFDKFLFVWWLGFVFAVILVFRSIFSSGPAVWGDAPYFYPESFKDFLSEPLAWESRGRLGVVNDLYWIYPLMLIYYGLGAVIGLSNDVIIRLVFYLPAIFFSFLSSWMFTRYFGFSPLVQMFSVFVYSLNTYFILLIDGGQVGVALAYGIFPLALLYLHKLVENRTSSQFFSSLALFMLLTISDVRFAVIAVFTLIVWIGFERLNSSRKIRSQQLKVLFYLFLASVALSLYWLIPAFVIEPTTGSGLRSDLKLISVLNPIFLFSPHWPLNEFGKIFPPPWYFAFLPLLIFSNIFFKKTKYASMVLINFLLFAFLVKGESGFLGGIYAWVVDTIPLGGAFRDSTKFFAPLLLFAGILIGLSVENLTQRMKKQIFARLLICLVFIYLLFLVYPAITGQMHGVLAVREFPGDIQIIADKISSEKGFLRTLWFPERHPLGFNSERKPALDAKTLVNLHPFASLNVGIIDRFNFLHNKQFLEWLDIFGIRYLIFSGDTRKVLPDEEKDKDWNNLLSLVEGTRGLDRVKWSTIFPVYQTERSKPRLFAVDKVFAVVGGDDIYQQLLDFDSKFSIGNQGFVFFEDGKFDPRSLQEISSNSLVLVFNQKEIKDLRLSFLSEFFQAPMDATRSQWALRSTDEYLKWKFELLVNEVATSEFDYGKGIAFSSQPNEELIFSLKAPEDSEYVLAVRHMSASESGLLRMSLVDQEDEISLSLPGRFNWYTKQIKLNAGHYDLALKNPGGFQVINVVALIPKRDWESGDKLTQNLLSKFLTSSNVKELTSLSNWYKISYKMVSPVKYDVEVSPKISWVVFTDNHHPKWILKTGSTDQLSYPFYSAVNGFYIGQNGLKDGKLFFKEQDKLRVAVGLSLISLVVLEGILLWIYYINKRSLISSRCSEIKQSLKFSLRSNYRRKKSV